MINRAKGDALSSCHAQLIRQNSRVSEFLEEKKIQHQFENNLECINLVYSITKLKEQVYYLLEKDPEYMSKSKGVKNSFFDDNYFEKSSNKLSKTRVLPTRNSFPEAIDSNWNKKKQKLDFDNSRSELDWRRMRPFLYHENIDVVDEEEDW